MIKVGVIGCGTIANSAHIPCYMDCPDAEIKYFCDIIPERAQAAVEKYGCGIAVTDYHDAHIQFGGHGITVVDLG